MAYSLGIYSPFVRPTQAGGEMSARAGFYGKKLGLTVEQNQDYIGLMVKKFGQE